MFIYSLSSSAEPDNIRYIGKAKDLKDRLRRHLGKYYLENEITHKNNWIKSELSKGNLILIKEIEEVNEENWIEREIYWISKFKDDGYELTNGTSGGEGIILTKEVIKRRNETRIENTNNKYREYFEKYNIRFEDFNIRFESGFWKAEKICECGEEINYSYKKKYNLIDNLKNNLNKCKCHKPVIKNKSKKLTKKLKKTKTKDVVILEKKIDKDLKRLCPICSDIINYSRIGSFNRANQENRVCNSCKSSGDKNYFYGKKLNDGKEKQEKYGTKILQYDLDDNLIQEFKSIREASEKTGIDRKSISNCAKGIKHYNTAGGFKFKIKE